jgi:heme/copper-type cytochrome/quinol oxidase subunit 1
MIFYFVSGVVLANASLDVAFHDTINFVGYSILFISTLTTLLNEKIDLNIKYDFKNEFYDNYNEYIKMF